jgi:hypothetical protein
MTCRSCPVDVEWLVDTSGIANKNRLINTRVISRGSRSSRPDWRSEMTENKKKKLRDAIREIRDQYHRWITEEIQAYPHKSYAAIGREYGLSEGTVYQIARLQGLCRNAPEAAAPAGEASE